MAENCAPFRKEQEEGDEVVIDEEEDNSSSQQLGWPQFQQYAHQYTHLITIKTNGPIQIG